MSESEYPKGGSAPERKETERQTSLVVTHDGTYDQRIAEALKSGNYMKLKFINAYNMPDRPPVDLKYVYINSDPKFHNEQHEKNWKDVKFSRLIWNRDGSFAGFSSQK